MNVALRFLPLAAIATLVGGCATSSIKRTWKSPEHPNGPAHHKVAVLTVEDREWLRQAFEGRFSKQLKLHGQDACVTYDLLNLPAIKADKAAAAAKLRETGADAVLIARLVDKSTYNRQVSTASFDRADWHEYYAISFADLGTVWGRLKDYVYLDTSLYDLKSGQRLWSALSLTVLREDMDRAAEMTPLVIKILNAARKDGVIR